MKRLVALLLSLVTLVALTIAILAWLGLRSDRLDPGHAPSLEGAIGRPVERGAYLALAANCRGCHTARDGADYAGGRAISTPFGIFHSPNLTPDPKTGIGGWSADQFWLALHEGRGRGGQLLYPVFPYTHYTKISREDADAIFAYLGTLPAVERANRPHALNFPYDQRWLLVAWRALFFRPGIYEVATDRGDDWNRGAYLVQGLGHCGACHESRNALGAIQSRDNPAGGLVLDWYAPTLSSGTEAGVSHWSQEQVVSLLQTGVTPGATASGPMAEVVFESLQHLASGDLQAMATYLRSLPDREAAGLPAQRAQRPRELDASMERGRRIYGDRCADCHGREGEGDDPDILGLARNRAVTMPSTVNPIRMVLYGGYAPGTDGNPRPFGMPPYHGTLSDQDVADVLTFVRGSWGNAAGPVSDFEVRRERTGPLW